MRLIKMVLTVILIVVCMLKKSTQKLPFFGEEETSTDQITCLEIGFEKYFGEYSNVNILTGNPKNIVKSLWKAARVVVTEWNSSQVISLVDRGPVIIFLEGKPDKDFNGLEGLQGLVVARKVLLVCITNPICSSQIYIEKILRMVDNSHLHYVAMNDGGAYDVYEFRVNIENKCGIPQLLRLGECSNKSTVKKMFEPLVNFHRCPLRLITWEHSAVPKSCALNYEFSKNCGVDEIAVNILLERLNATLAVLSVQTAADVSNLVMHRYGDIGCGMLLDTHFHEGVSYTTPYMFIKATVVAPISTMRIDGSMSRILLPLKPEVWLGIGVVMVFVFVLVILVPDFRRIHALQLFGLFLGIPLPRMPRKLTRQICFISVTLFGYFCSQSYLTHLTQALSSPEEHLIETLDELEYSNIQVVGLSEARKKFKDEYPRIYRDFQMQDYMEYRDNIMKLWTGRSKSAFYVEVTAKTIGLWENKELRSLNSEISWYPVTMVVSNSSTHLLKIFNRVLYPILENGIAPIRDRRFSPVDIIFQDDHSTSSTGQHRILKYDDLESVFEILMIGLGLSCLVFFIEIITPLIRKKFIRK